MKKRWILAGIAAIAIAITACTNKKEVVKTDAQKFKEEYESINGTKREKDGKEIRTIEIAENNPMVYATAEEIAKMMDDKETFAVYFGFKDCPWCRSMVTTLIECANELKLTKIYYVDVKEIRDTLEVKDGEIITSVEGSEGYYQLLAKLDNVLSDYALNDVDGNPVDTNEKRIYAPNVVVVKNGEALELTDGISDKQTDAYGEISDDMITDMQAKIVNALGLIVSEPGCSVEKGC